MRRLLAAVGHLPLLGAFTCLVVAAFMVNVLLGLVATAGAVLVAEWVIRRDR